MFIVADLVSLRNVRNVKNTNCKKNRMIILESQPKNPEISNNTENVHQCSIFHR